MGLSIVMHCFSWIWSQSQSVTIATRSLGNCLHPPESQRLALFLPGNYDTMWRKASRNLRSWFAFLITNVSACSVLSWRISYFLQQTTSASTKIFRWEDNQWYTVPRMREYICYINYISSAPLYIFTVRSSRTEPSKVDWCSGGSDSDRAPGWRWKW